MMTPDVSKIQIEPLKTTTQRWGIRVCQELRHPVLFYRRPTVLAHVILCTFPCFAILIVSSKVMSSTVAGSKSTCSWFAPSCSTGGLWRGISVVNWPFEAPVNFTFSPSMYERISSQWCNYSLRDGRHGSLHHKESQRSTLKVWLCREEPECLLTLKWGNFGKVTRVRKRRKTYVQSQDQSAILSVQ